MLDATHKLQHPGTKSDSASDVLSVVCRAGRKKARQDGSDDADDAERELTKEARKARAAEAKERKKAEAAAEKEMKKLHRYSQSFGQDGGVHFCSCNFVSWHEWLRREQEKAAKLAAKDVQKQEKQKEKVENRASKGTCIHMAD